MLEVTTPCGVTPASEQPQAHMQYKGGSEMGSNMVLTMHFTVIISGNIQAV